MDCESELSPAKLSATIACQSSGRASTRHSEVWVRLWMGLDINRKPRGARSAVQHRRSSSPAHMQRSTVRHKALCNSHKLSHLCFREPQTVGASGRHAGKSCLCLSKSLCRARLRTAMLQPFAVPAFLHETPCQACQCPVMASRNLTGRRRNDDATQFAIFVTRGLESLMRCVEHWYVSTSPRTQRRLCNLVHRRTLMVERHIAEPWYIPSANAQMLSAEDAGYWSKVADGMYLSYLCRKKACMFFGGNHVETWIMSRSLCQLRCPMCGCLYNTGQPEEGEVIAKRVLTITDPLTGKVTHIPTEELDPISQHFLNNWIELTAQDMQNQDPVPEGACPFWVRLPYRPNSHTTYIDPIDWDVTRQVRAGHVLGLHLSDVEDACDTWTDWPGLITFFADAVKERRCM